MEVQKYLFEVLKARIPDQHRMVDIVEELLGISTDAAYKRIRGQKELSFTELRTLSQKFNLPLEEIFSYKSEQTAIFSYVPVNFADQEAYIQYLNNLNDGMAVLKASSDKEIYFAAQDIPIFHFSKYPDLTLFKLYAWNDAIIHKQISFIDFCNKLDKDRIMPIFQQIHNSYLVIPSKEIWTEQTIGAILRLLEHYYAMGAFKDKKALFFLIEQLQNLIEDVKNYTNDGCKPKDTPFTMYASPVDLENNFMLTRRGSELMCRIKLYTINSITTINQAMCAETKKWIDDLISKSTQISEISAKQRVKFFKELYNKIDVLIDKIK